MKQYMYLTLALLFCLLSGCAKDISEESIDSTKPTVIASEHATEETHKEEPAMETQPQLLLDPKDSDFVRVRDYIPDIQEDLKYATNTNFTGAVIYDFQDTYLRYGTVKKLMAAAQELRTLNLSIKIWDGFRPVSAQFKLWDIFPDDTYVANPNIGYSNHSRGNAIDLTLVDASGQELEMPTEFDDFSGRADRNYAEIDAVPRANSQLLEDIMHKHGFKGYYGEWWHYADTVRYDVETVFDPNVIATWQTNQDSALLDLPEVGARSYTVIPVNAYVTVMGYVGNYALVSYDGLRGYVVCMALSPM